MSAKKSFAGTPYSRPPSTPRQQIARRESSGGSILKTLFTPSRWFSKKVEANDTNGGNATESEDPEDGSESSEEEEEEEDEESNIGMSNSADSREVQKPNTTRLNSKTNSRTPNDTNQARDSSANSPNSVLATFFQNKGDAPLTSIELEGVKALLAKQSGIAFASDSENHLPSYVTPIRRPYQPIFTPAKALPTTEAMTEVKKVRRGYTPTASAASPFAKRNPARSGFTQIRAPHPAQFATPAKYELRATIENHGDDSEKSKRPLDEVLAPKAKRTKQDEQEQSSSNQQAATTTSTGNRTAASMLEILQADTQPEAPSDHKSPENLKSMLNPYATASSARKPAGSPRRTPVRKQARSAIEEIERSEAMEKKLPFQPKKSSGLTNSFSADDDTSLFSPRRRVASPANGKGASQPGITQIIQASRTNDSTTPTKNALSFNHSTKNATPNMFSSDTSIKTFSTTPKFSFGASQVSSKSSFTTEADVSNSHEPLGPEMIEFAKPSGSSSTMAANNGAPAELRLKSAGQDSEHTKYGGFAVSSKVPAFAEQNTRDSSDEAKEAFKGTGKSTSSEIDSQKDDEVVVHQLRDGTEYVSPSKSNIKSSTSTAPPQSTNGGFVFKPTHTKSSSSFSFNNFKPNTTQPSQGGFVFDPTRGSTKATVIESSSKPTTADVTAPRDPKQRALAASASQLQQFDFTITAKSIYNDVKADALKADLVQYVFSVPAIDITSPADPIPAPSLVKSAGFNWAAAGLTKPAAGWTCDVCMINNKDDTQQCVSCEAERPSTSQKKEISTDKEIEAPTSKSTVTNSSSGGFNWAAAGMKVPEQQWSCSTCMTSNPTSANACLACEAER